MPTHHDTDPLKDVLISLCGGEEVPGLESDPAVEKLVARYPNGILDNQVTWYDEEAATAPA